MIVFFRNLVKIVGNNDQSLDAACVRARSLGYTPLLMYSGLEGEANVMATVCSDNQRRNDIEIGRISQEDQSWRT